MFARIFSVTALIALLTFTSARAEEKPVRWDRQAAGTYLDQCAKAWFEFSSARRGTGATQTTCVSCHTVLPMVLAWPALRPEKGKPTEYEAKVLAQAMQRVERLGKTLTPEPTGSSTTSMSKKRRNRAAPSRY